jgi:hypothetical protein
MARRQSGGSVTGSKRPRLQQPARLPEPLRHPPRGMYGQNRQRERVAGPAHPQNSCASSIRPAISSARPAQSVRLAVMPQGMPQARKSSANSVPRAASALIRSQDGLVPRKTSRAPTSRSVYVARRPPQSPLLSKESNAPRSRQPGLAAQPQARHRPARHGWPRPVGEEATTGSERAGQSRPARRGRSSAMRCVGSGPAPPRPRLAFCPVTKSVAGTNRP